MASRLRASIVVPAYNEHGSVLPLVEAVRPALAGEGAWELLGPFVAKVGLRLNLPAGNCVIETGVYGPIRHRQAASGPVIRLEIREGASFWESLEMNPPRRSFLPRPPWTPALARRVRSLY